MEERRGDSDGKSDKYEGQITDSQYWDKLLKKKTNELVRNPVKSNVNLECHWEPEKANGCLSTLTCTPMELLNSRINKKSQVPRVNKQVIYQRGRKFSLDSALSASPDTRRQ